MQTVLIVDDNAKLLKMLQRTLAYEGLQVFTATNGEEALHQADDYSPNLLIVDWMMPKMDGLTLVQKFARGKESGNDFNVDRAGCHRESRRGIAKRRG